MSNSSPHLQFIVEFHLDNELSSINQSGIIGLTQVCRFSTSSTLPTCEWCPARKLKRNDYRSGAGESWFGESCEFSCAPVTPVKPACAAAAPRRDLSIFELVRAHLCLCVPPRVPPSVFFFSKQSCSVTTYHCRAFFCKLECAGGWPRRMFCLMSGWKKKGKSVSVIWRADWSGVSCT